MVLALLGEGDMHPYEMIRLMRLRRDDRLVTITNGTLYHTVGRLERAGLLAEVGVDRDGNRPERTTYALTDGGPRAVGEWVRRELPRIDRPAEFRIALAEAHNLDRGRGRSSCSRARRARAGRARSTMPPRAARKPIAAGVPRAVPARGRTRRGAARGRPRLARRAHRAPRATDSAGAAPSIPSETLHSSSPTERPHDDHDRQHPRRRATRHPLPRRGPARSPWPALWALVIGFFMILVDTTIVSVANPAIKAALDPDTNNLDNVVWVTSAYLLAYAVPLLITGRLGDRFGPKHIYLIGLAVFTLASLGCGLSATLELLIIARAVQGLGAALMTPQTMAVITRTFPPNRRGAAMGLWGATAGVATLVGPLAGGLLVDGFGWEWIFFINIPVGIIGFVLAWILVPQARDAPAPVRHRRACSSAPSGLFLIVFGLQEGENYDWGVIWGPITVWGSSSPACSCWACSSGRRRGPRASRSCRWSCSGTATSRSRTSRSRRSGFTVTSMSLPLMFFIQLARGLTPTQSALLLIPMAVLSGVLAPFAGRLLDRTDPRFLLVPGLLLVAGSLVWYSMLMNADTPIWMFLLPSALMGIGNAGMWGPLATTATRNLPMRQAGAGAGIYNTTRTVGSVIGSAAIAAFMQAASRRTCPARPRPPAASAAARCRDFVVDGFSTAMAQAILLPAAVMLIGVVAVLFLRRPKAIGRGRVARRQRRSSRPWRPPRGAARRWLRQGRAVTRRGRTGRSARGGRTPRCRVASTR